MIGPEAEAMALSAAYAMELRGWLRQQGIAETVDPNPLIGVWDLGVAGKMEFTADTFAWYRDRLGGDAYRGDYAVYPGVKTHAGFILDRGAESSRCLSILAHYTIDEVDGHRLDADRYGGFFVEQLGSLDRMEFYNQRTAGRFVGRRVAAGGASEASQG